MIDIRRISRHKYKTKTKNSDTAKVPLNTVSKT